MPADKFPDVFRNLNPRGLTIVNLSLGTPNTLSPVLDRLGDKGPDFLFVVAAGNYNSALGQPKPGGTAVHHHYPASYGGPDNEGQANLITVAGLYKEDTGWRRAWFSDYGSSHVELGAPGCAVPVVHYERDEESWTSRPRYEDGTSFAAPLVSFAAGLISSERSDLSAPQIKNRILAAADLVPALVAEIADGRTLNLVKAAAVSQDVMEAGGQILRGSMQLIDVARGAPLQPNDPLPIRCVEGPQDGLRLSEVVKIVPSFNREIGSPVAAQFPDRVYAVRGAKRQLKSLSCALTDEIAVQFQREGTVGMPPYRWQEIRDLVPRMP